ncbi:hypothetical protein ACT3TZ_10790 [Brachybacterium sp. AOP25-B2-12]|uniref:hypothetical protein n=1 Tax=Brachybacterium sp. AOP25-B2-12 TaxID=3457710 RepID=UPI0040340469
MPPKASGMARALRPVPFGSSWVRGGDVPDRHLRSALLEAGAELREHRGVRGARPARGDDRDGAVGTDADAAHGLAVVHGGLDGGEVVVAGGRERAGLGLLDARPDLVRGLGGTADRQRQVFRPGVDRGREEGQDHQRHGGGQAEHDRHELERRGPFRPRRLGLVLVVEHLDVCGGGHGDSSSRTPALNGASRSTYKRIVTFHICSDKTWTTDQTVGGIT